MTKKDILYFGTCVVGLGINSICAACCCKPKLDDGKQNLDMVNQNQRMERILLLRH